MLVARRWWSRIDVCAHAPRAASAVSWVLHRDADVLVVDKPAGVPMRSVHGVKGVDAFLADLRFDLAHPPMTVHRLDRDTTGCLILARTREAQRTLAGYFQDRARVARRGSGRSTKTTSPESLGDVRRVYWALVSATSTLASRGTIDAPLVTTHAGVTLKPGAGAKPAATDYEVISRASPDVLAPTAAGRVPAVLALVPRTGRKHQLRVHCAGALDAAIVGDYKYGYRDVSRTGGVADDWRRLLRDVDESTRRLGAGSSDGEVRGTGVPLHLHARCVEFTHPSSGERVRVVAPPPSHMSLACEALGLALAGGDDDGRLLDFNRR